MKRPRNVDCGKPRRPLKRNKIVDGFYGRCFRVFGKLKKLLLPKAKRCYRVFGKLRKLLRKRWLEDRKRCLTSETPWNRKSTKSDVIDDSTFLYIRFLLVWVLVLIADFILEFRFEYLWPFWLLLRSVYDSFKYQGLAFSVFFVCIAITSDVMCYLFIPVQWLFFAASTYVWVQYVWHTERGICLSTVSLWLLFVYIEVSVRLRDLKNLPFNLDLCRPFAAHCIGYPVVTLGFGFKSYISYRMRLRRQKVVQKENEFYNQLLQQALPPEAQYSDKQKALPSRTEEEVVSNGVAGKKPSKTEEEKEGKKAGKPTTDLNEDDELEYIEKSLPKKPNVNQFDECADNFASDSQAKAFKSNTASAVNGKPAGNPSKLNTSKDLTAKKGKNYSKDISPATFSNNKDEHINRLEADVKKLKADLQASRNCEQELRSQIGNLVIGDRSMRSELYQLQQDNENLQNKLHNLVTSRQQDKQNIGSLEKKLQEERKVRATLEQQLAMERKTKKAEEAAAARAVAMATAARGECTDSCKARRRDIENDMKQLKRDLKLREEQFRQLEREVQALRQYKDAQKEAEVLMAALGAMQDKNTELENNLSAETRFKQDLFSALGEERRQIRNLEGVVVAKDAEIAELKSKIAEVMALIPSTSSYQNLGSERNTSPLFSPKFVKEELTVVSSHLNPNAADYTPTSAH